MRKNGSRLISLGQYRLTDLFLFAVILVVFELILHYALIYFSGDFTYSPLIPMVLLVMMRWGWPSVFYAVLDGVLFCILNGFGWQSYVMYGVGNAFIMFLLIMTKLMGKEKIAGKWYFSALFVVLGWVAVYLGRAAVAACVGLGFVNALIGQMWELLSLVVGILIILLMRRLDGMFEDQRHYLLRLDAERRDKQRRDEYGDEPIELDEEKLSFLRRDDDGLK